MLDHMTVVIEEVPSIVLLTYHVIPKRIDELKKMYMDKNINVFGSAGHAFDK